MSLVKKAAAPDRPLPEFEPLDSCASWREASGHVRTAYRWWSECAIRHRALAFAIYRVALDRERDAASILSGPSASARSSGPDTTTTKGAHRC
jgi:hypothetical protein